jgi:hypothetical protein
MPAKETIKRARAAKREGKSTTTQAGEFVHEEIKHIREGKHGARSAKQAIAIGLSKARRAGVKLSPPKRGASAATRQKTKQDLRSGATRHKVSATRSRATSQALKKEGHSAVSHRALSTQARRAARRRASRS